MTCNIMPLADHWNVAASQPSLASVAANTPKGTPIKEAVTRTYYIQAQETEWNYAPAGKNRCPSCCSIQGAALQEAFLVDIAFPHSSKLLLTLQIMTVTSGDLPVSPAYV